MIVLLPKLFSLDLGGLIDWAERIIVFFEQSIEEAQDKEIPVGMVMDRASTSATADPGWLLCNGQVVSASTFPLLAALLGTSFNTGGEGAGNFRLPSQTVTIGSLAGCKRFIKHD